MERVLSPLDRAIGAIDRGLRVLFAPTAAAERADPAADIPEATLDDVERANSGGLMRVNHSGEVCAQALYQGQALTAESRVVREKLECSAREENDHLSWTAQRLDQLGTHTSYLNPIWYAGSFAIGAVAGLAGDRWSLGFLAETERRVVEHLAGHLARLPVADKRSRAIVEQMRLDEGRHATVAIEAGARDLPLPAKFLMRGAAKIMTSSAYWI